MSALDLMALAERLFPIPRSITGDGVRRTLEILSEVIPLEIHEVPSGTRALDWTVPKEWRVNEAWIEGPDGRRIADYVDSPLHLVSYSEPQDRTMPLEELRPHLHSLPDRPSAIPYRVTYYEQGWGFCLSHEVLEGLPDGDYRVHIDTELFDGSLTYGEFVRPGLTDEELFLSSHVCHPAMANDNTSGMVVAAEVGRRLLDRTPGEFGVRILFAPSTIGTITWLARNRDVLSNMAGGLTLECLGDGGPLTYKRTVFGDRSIDRAAAFVLDGLDGATSVDFTPFGYDERQHNSPGFRLPVGSLMRSHHGNFPEYHTSLDDLSFITDAQLRASADAVEEILDVLQHNRRYRNLEPFAEPQLGRRGLYEADPGAPTPKELSYAMLWVLNLSDGDHDLIDIATRSGIGFDVVASAAARLRDAGLLEER